MNPLGSIGKSSKRSQLQLGIHFFSAILKKIDSNVNNQTNQNRTGVCSVEKNGNPGKKSGHKLIKRKWVRKKNQIKMSMKIEFKESNFFPRRIQAKTANRIGLKRNFTGKKQVHYHSSTFNGYKMEWNNHFQSIRHTHTHQPPNRPLLLLLKSKWS